MPTTHWKGPRADPDVVEAIEQALGAAKKGHIRCVVVVAVNPVFEADTIIAGEVQGARRHVMIGALSSAAHKLIQEF